VQSVRLAAGTVVAQLEQVEVCGVIASEAPKRVENERLEAIKRMVERVDSGVSDRYKNRLMELLCEFSAAFSLSENELGRTSVANHAIDTGEARPVRQRLRRQPPAYQEIIKDHVESMLKQGVIVPAQSPWAANIVLVKKNDSDHRCCIDTAA